MKHIGIMGGTFDPPHIGHLIVAQEVLGALNLDEIWFIPSHEPPHKQKAAVDASYRVEMLERAITGNPLFKLSTIEVNRLGKSYTLDTINTLNKEHPEARFYFIIGADMVSYLPHWHNINELLDSVTFVGVKRNGFELNSDYPILKVDVPQIDISSTDIKKRLGNNKSVKYMVPWEVETYLKEKQLYGKK